MIYGYSRISTAKQNIDRQIRNIQLQYPEAKIYKETYTGTKTTGRTEFNKMISRVRAGDTIVFDSVSRMSRNADEGVELYFKLYDKNVNLVFLKEPYVNTDTYRQAVNNADSISTTGNEIADEYIKATQKVLKILAEKQIRIAFEQAQKEVDDLRKRTSEGIETARRNGKQIGQVKGRTLNVKKKKPCKDYMIKRLKSFGGDLKDKEAITLLGIDKNTFYKYKKEILEEMGRDK